MSDELVELGALRKSGVGKGTRYWLVVGKQLRVTLSDSGETTG